MPKWFVFERQLQGRNLPPDRLLSKSISRPNRTMRSRATVIAYLLAISAAMVGWTGLLLMGITWAIGF